MRELVFWGVIGLGLSALSGCATRFDHAQMPDTEGTKAVELGPDEQIQDRDLGDGKGDEILGQ